MKLKNIVTLSLLFFLCLWISIAISRTGYNVSKLITEEKKWYGLTDEQKKALQFGDLHYFFRFAQTHIKSGTTVFFITDNNEAYYLSRYYLYPTEVVRKNEPGLWDPQNTSYAYYLLYPANHTLLLQEARHDLFLKTYQKIATYQGTHGEIGIIYKR